MATATPTPLPSALPTAPLSPAAASADTTAVERAVQAAQVTGFRIMRETEISPHWWGSPVEIGETGSAIVAYNFCAEQNAVTDDPNRLTKRHRYFAEPVMADEGATNTDPVVAEQHRIERVAAGLHAGESTVINGTHVTAVSLPVAEALTRYETASLHAAELAAQSAAGEDLPAVDVRSWEFAEELMAGARAVLAEAGMLHLIGGAS